MKQIYYMMLVPAALLFAAFFAAQKAGFVTPGQFRLTDVWHAIFFIAATLTAVAGPIFIRTLFAHNVKDNTRTAEKDFLALQKRLLWVSGLTPYIAFASVACELPQFHSAAIVLMALYGVYYYYPSQRRIRFDRKIFRVENAS